MQGLSQYTLVAPIHTGPVHVLYRGYRESDRAPVIVKVLRNEQPSQHEVARLRHEYLIAQQVRAPGVVRALGLEKVGHVLGLILEDFGGRPLDEILREKKLDLKTSLDIAARVVEAVGALHDHRIIHKDIKPSNILINDDTGEVKLTDFGVATRLSQETKAAARPDALEGTLAYMSPEQTGRMNRALDYRTDLYSFGVTLYEMLTGGLPFPTTDPLELLHSHIARTPPPVDERAAGVPEVVSAIVMKLLAKAAEDRYQSAHGLLADLDECRRRLAATGKIEPFPLGAKDVTSDLRIVHKLYGREVERELLLATFDRVSRGDAALVLISGYAGVGKSALVSELYQALARGTGYFAAGKFGQRARNVPYTAIATALRELVRHVLTGPEEAIARWKSAILAAVGSNGKILLDLVPDLELLIGPQPAVPDLGPTESQNRFGLVFQSFLRVFTTREHPVVLFLDDLHWADPASLRLLSLLLTDPERGYLMIVGTYRDHEVDAGHLLTLAIADLRKQGASIHEHALPPLDVVSAEQLVTDALGEESPEAKELAQIVFEKTQGNPLFMGQFLKTLHDDGEITFDRERGAFRIDLARAQAAMVTDNVIDLMAAKIKKLSPRTQRALKLASCIGYRFDLTTLSLISETPPPETAAALWESLLEGLVLPLDTGYQLATEADAHPGTGVRPAQALDVNYRFLHDRVQQAAYALIDEPQRMERHLQIGRLLYARSNELRREERLLEIVDHLNLGAPAIVDRGERLDVARLSLLAGRRAKAAAAYQAAAGYFAAGTALLDEECFEDEYDLAFALNAERAECEYLNGQYHAAESIFETLLARAQSKLDRARVYTLLIVLYTLRGQLGEAVRAGRAGLALFGVELPETEDELKAAFDAELSAIKVNLAGRRITDLINAPRLTDPEVLAHLELLVKLRPSTFFSGPVISSVVIAMPVNLCIKHGLSELAEPIYSGIGYTLISLRGMYEEARAFFQLSSALAERSTETRVRCNADLLLGGHAHFFVPFREAKTILERAQRVGLQTGDFLFLSFACYHATMVRICAGEELHSVDEEIGRYFALIKRTRNAFTHAILVVARQLIAALTGRTKGRTLLSDGAFDEAAHLSMAESARFTFAVAYYHYAKLVLAALYGDYATALEEADKVKKTAGNAAFFHFATDVPFYAGLALAGLYPSATPDEQEVYAASLGEHEETIALWARYCPANYLPKQLLLGAEAARISGRETDARSLYDQAIAMARDGELTHLEALGNELAAMCCIGQKQMRAARAHLDEAYHGYLRWGATEKAIALAEKHAALMGGGAPESRAHPDPTRISSTSSTGGGKRIDHMALVRAAQAISGEIVLDQLLDRLMRIVLASAGADRGVLLLAREDRLVPEAIMTVDPDVVRVALDGSLDTSPGLAESVVKLVERTKEPVVLGDAGASSPFRGDVYLSERPPKSLVCMAMVHRGRLAGILYLENHVARDAFTPERVELCSLLASQAAIAVENALLVDELSRRTAALGESNKALETANQALRTTNDQLARELFERGESDAARAALVDELRRTQTPLIPITDQIMVMPLIGTIDASRARQILEAALYGVAKSRASVVILDVTGVRSIDSGVTGMVAGVAGALRLLGAKAVITGIRPGLAQELVSMDVDMGGLVTRGTLQSGIAYAMGRPIKKR